MAEEKDKIVGIDLGTTNSVVAAWEPGPSGATVLKDQQGDGVQPSVVSFHPNGSVLVGAEAKQRKVIDPHNTVYSAKRLIGRTFRSQEVSAAARRMPYTIKEGPNEQPVIATRAGEFAIPEISAIILDHMRKIAVAASGAEVTRAVVTVPASFTDAQRSATATAGAIAGLTVVRVLNEPTAAALVYGHQRNLNEVIAVYDFGGGTFDISILKLQDTVFEVLATAGDSFLGGDDIDERLVEHMMQLFLREQRVDLRENQIAVQRLRGVAEQVKIELSRRTSAVVKIDEIAYGAGGQPLSLELEITRDEFLSKIADIIEASFPVCREAVAMAGLTPQQVNDVVLVGGTTKMPFVREQVAKLFGQMPRTDVNPDEAVALGAALQAASLERILGGNRRRATSQGGLRRTAEGFAAAPSPTERSARPGQFPDALPVRPPGGTQPLARITKRAPAAPPPIPTAGPNQRTLAPGVGFEDVSTDVPTAVRDPDAGDTSPDEFNVPTNQFARGPSTPIAPTAIGLPSVNATVGAAARAHQPGAPPTATVIDITPHSLGIATIAGFCEGIISRNAKVPTETKKLFSTSRDLQRVVRIRVCQGESRRIDDNLVLGDLVLEGLEPRPRGETKIEVTFQLDASGILHVRARDRATGLEQRANLDLAGAQSPEEIAAAQQRFRDLRR
ncbi:MAG TPA: Hsp70 family protein [Kofleriaceae bacterium]|nr:Hsp70 family protein [Kofleriaceae bacterium]